MQRTEREEQEHEVHEMTIRDQRLSPEDLEACRPFLTTAQREALNVLASGNFKTSDWHQECRNISDLRYRCDQYIEDNQADTDDDL